MDAWSKSQSIEESVCVCKERAHPAVNSFLIKNQLRFFKLLLKYNNINNNSALSRDDVNTHLSMPTSSKCVGNVQYKI